ncbi:MAG TPA: hypothetical protein VHF47_03565 [Acidimicrobiales bacterium]|nr:hypothetical protein [Acidimicrobiales bacterium]
MRLATLRAVMVSLTVIVTAVVGAAPGEARCLAADVIVHWTHQADQPVVTDGQCLVPTSFGAYLWNEVEVNVPTVTGAPAGAYVEVWVPLP